MGYSDNWYCDSCGTGMHVDFADGEGEVNIDPPYFCNDCVREMDDAEERVIEKHLAEQEAEYEKQRTLEWEVNRMGTELHHLINK
jgi:hypothetical protein